MNKNNRVVIILLILVIALLAFIAFKPKDDDTLRDDKNVTNEIQKRPAPSGENSPSESFTNQPGAIKSIKQEGGSWTLSVDLLTPNEKWLPGVDSTGGFFINQNLKLRTLTVTKDTKIQDCATQYGDPARFKDAASFMTSIQPQVTSSTAEFGYTAYFDITGTSITKISEQCLP